MPEDDEEMDELTAEDMAAQIDSSPVVEVRSTPETVASEIEHEQAVKHDDPSATRH